jgi:hypothetical protein
LGNPNAPQSSSVYIMSISQSAPVPSLKTVVKTGPQVGQVEDGIAAYGGSHPNAVVAGPNAIYVSNGNNDTISILHPTTLQEIHLISLAVLDGFDAHIKGVQPVALALSPDANWLYVAEAGINAVGVLRLTGKTAHVEGHIPVGWWPSAVQASPDGNTLYVASARGRGAPANNDGSSPKASTIGTVNIIPVPSGGLLQTYSAQVLKNNGFVPGSAPQSGVPIPNSFGIPSDQIKHIIFINKENSTHDQLLGDITMTRKGAPVDGDPAYSLGQAASPNHHEIALEFALSDNF